MQWLHRIVSISRPGVGEWCCGGWNAPAVAAAVVVPGVGELLSWWLRWSLLVEPGVVRSGNRDKAGRVSEQQIGGEGGVGAAAGPAVVLPDGSPTVIVGPKRLNVVTSTVLPFSLSNSLVSSSKQLLWFPLPPGVGSDKRDLDPRQVAILVCGLLSTPSKTVDGLMESMPQERVTGPSCDQRRLQLLLLLLLLLSICCGGGGCLGGCCIGGWCIGSWCIGSCCIGRSCNCCIWICCNCCIWQACNCSHWWNSWRNVEKSALWSLVS